jgi:ribosomal protein S18 acetylase RimI-like enzyme
MISTRLAVSVDMPRIADLHVQSWQSTYKRQFSRERLHGDIRQELVRFWHSYEPSPADIIAVAEKSDTTKELLGFCAIWCKDTPYLDNLHVAPSAKGLGIGRTILAFASSELSKRGYNSLSLSVFSENERARVFYRRLQGVETEEYEQVILGRVVPSVRVCWTDLGPLARAMNPDRS